MLPPYPFRVRILRHRAVRVRPDRALFEPEEIVNELGLQQISDTGELQKIIEKCLTKDASHRDRKRQSTQFLEFVLSSWSHGPS